MDVTVLGRNMVIIRGTVENHTRSMTSLRLVEQLLILPERIETAHEVHLPRGSNARSSLGIGISQTTCHPIASYH